MGEVGLRMLKVKDVKEHLEKFDDDLGVYIQEVKDKHGRSVFVLWAHCFKKKKRQSIMYSIKDEAH